MSKIDVSIVIVNYRVKYFLEQTIRSAQEALQNLAGEIIVVDNNSCDGSMEHIRKAFPDVICIENKENQGFGRANNQGFDIARGEYTLILNPDTIIGSDTIADCLDFYHSHPDCGGIGVNMHDGAGVFLPESKRSFPTPWVSFCKIFGLSKLFPNSPRFAKYHLRYLSAGEVHSVDILSGAFIFIKTSLLSEIKGFDEDFFMYGEDIDLSFRIVEKGYKNYYIPTPIIHYKGESTKKNSFRYVKVFYEAMHIFFKKHYPNYSRFYGFFITFAIKLRAAMSMMKRFFGRLFPSRKMAEKPLDNIIIVSADSAPIIVKLASMPGKMRIVSTLSEIEIPASGDNLIVIDNRACSYQDVINFICRNCHTGNTFATYLSQSGVLITPSRVF